MPYSKIQWVLAILMIFGLILATNLIDRKNFNGIKESMVSIYEDRLVVKDLIYNISEGIHQKELALVKGDSNFFKAANAKLNSNLDHLIEEFEATKLTQKEENTLLNFKETLATLLALESGLAEGDTSSRSDYRRLIDRSKSELEILSHIQMEEGKREFFHGKRRVASIEFFTQMEIFILIALAVLAQILIFYKPKSKRT